MRKGVYIAFVRRYGKYQQHWLFRYTAKFLELLLGPATFNYGGVNLIAGPVAYLDRFIILGQNINPLVTSAIKHSLKDGGVFLDIGANHGVFSLLAAKNPNIQVFAFEPFARELNRFWRNLALNPTNNVSVLAYAISDVEKKQLMALASDENPGRNSLPAISPSTRSETCHFSSLINLLSPDVLKRARVCKLDVEGQEMLILKSLQSHMTLLKNCVFIVEITPDFLAKINFSADDIYQFFTKAGFRAQFGPRPEECQWDEIFYHPEYNNEVPIFEGIH